ncbi:MAG: hypothetical protein R2854_29520 [Caldilineaceae bacterium]
MQAYTDAQYQLLADVEFTEVTLPAHLGDQSDTFSELCLVLHARKAA